MYLVESLTCLNLRALLPAACRRLLVEKKIHTLHYHWAQYWNSLKVYLNKHMNYEKVHSSHVRGCNDAQHEVQFQFSANWLWAVSSFEIYCLKICWHAQIFAVCSLSSTFFFFFLTRVMLFRLESLLYRVHEVLSGFQSDREQISSFSMPVSVKLAPLCVWLWVLKMLVLVVLIQLSIMLQIHYWTSTVTKKLLACAGAVLMASRIRRKKRPLPDWMGQSYDWKQHDDLSEPGGSTVKQSTQAQPHTSTPVQSGAAKPYSRGTSVGIANRQQHFNRKGDASVTCHNANSDAAVPLSAEEIIRLSLPLLKFDGSLIYSFNGSDCSLLCEEILSSLSHEDVIHVGFDMEWPVTFSAGASKTTALIQICTGEDKCYLFHIAVMGTLPRALKTLLSSSQIIKYGINIEADFWKLGRDFDIQVRDIIRESVKDLGRLANTKLKSTERWTLDGLTRNVLRKRLNKESAVRCGQWDHYPLSEEQLQYAAADAYAGWLLARCLRDKWEVAKSGSYISFWYGSSWVMVRVPYNMETSLSVNIIITEICGFFIV